MGAHAAPRPPRPARRRGLAALLGLAYGAAVGLVDRHAGADLGRAALLGTVAGVLAAVAAAVIGARLRMLPRIPRAGVLAACAGAAAAFLVGLSADGTTPRALIAGALLALAVGLGCFALSSPRR